MKLTATEVHDLKKFEEETMKFAGRIFEYASMLDVQYLLPHMYDLQNIIREKLCQKSDAL